MPAMVGPTYDRSANGGLKRLRQLSDHLQSTPSAATARSNVRCRASLAAAGEEEE